MGYLVPKGLLAPVSAKPPAKRAKPPPKGAAQSMHSGDHVQEFKVEWSGTKEFCVRWCRPLGVVGE